ncbi:phage tail sheath family protein [Halomonas cerina]|uniref:Tail sheath protein n=1 Tax=Halomonas cerina TaxID=447424 RepID=A0A839VEU0_9GAMM|nr:phage tail sheath C-terminal domain-containing protein [Halomonas cerina]MBB3191879.1 hypothetical protein [Halomonas cerina]
MADYEREFGKPHPKSDLAHSVQHFFTNGGTDCYVIRLAHNPSTADVTLQNLANTNVLSASAKYAGLWGNNLRLEVSYNTPSTEETFNLSIVQLDEEGDSVADEAFINLTMDPDAPRYAPDFVTESSELIDLALASGFNINTALSGAPAGYSESRRPLDGSLTTFRETLNDLIHPEDDTPARPFDERRAKFDISVNGGPYVAVDLRVDPTWTALTGNRGAVATELQNRINTQLPAGVTVACAFETVYGPAANPVAVLRITTNSGAQSSVHIRRAADHDLAGPLMLGLDQGGIEAVKAGSLRPAPTATLYTADANTLAELQQDAFNQISVAGVDISLLDGGGNNVLETTGASDRWHQDNFATTLTGNNDGVREKLHILAKAINDAPNVPASAEVWGYRLALLPIEGTMNATVSVTTGNAGGGGTDIGGNFTTNVRRYAPGNAGTSPFQDGAGTLGADDDGNPPNLSDYTGSKADQTGFHALDAVDLFNLMILPGDEEVAQANWESIWGEASVYCLNHRAFLLVDPPPTWTNASTGRPEVVQDTSLINALRANIVKDHAAVFYPRLRHNVNGSVQSIGPIGAIAGLMARTDANRGVWKAPAGIESGVRGIVGLTVALTDRENGVLNKKGVNCIRIFPNGTVNWGSRTLDGDDDFGSEWKYIPIRRLALMIEETLYRGTRWAVFEPNDERLWSNIRLNINAYMMGLFRQGAFQGTDPKAAFYVKCDKDTTTQNDRNKGIVNVEVGFAPVKPAEFVVIKIQQMAGEL